MFILKYKKLYISIALFFIVASGALSWGYGLNPSIDFSGGTIYEVAFPTERPAIDALTAQLSDVAPYAVVQHAGDDNIIIKAQTLSDEDKNKIDVVLQQFGVFQELRFKQLSPAISGELLNKSIFAILFVICIIVGFIAYTFSGVSKPVSSYKYGLVAIVALIHDTIIPIGIFALLGSLFVNFQIDVLFVTAILATLGYSVNDTIVVFDRVRENLQRNPADDTKVDNGEHFESVVAMSLRQTFRRSIYTSLTTFAALILLFWFGGSVTQPFALTLAVGVIAGTYSSLFLACPLLVWIERKQKKDMVDDNKDSDDSDNIPDDIKRFLAKQQDR